MLCSVLCSIELKMKMHNLNEIGSDRNITSTELEARIRCYSGNYYGRLFGVGYRIFCTRSRLCMQFSTAKMLPVYHRLFLVRTDFATIISISLFLVG